MGVQARQSSTEVSFAILGPVVQSILSLTSLLSGQLISVLRLFNQIHWYFLLKKWKKLLHCTIFNKRYWCISGITDWNFIETFANDAVSFEQPSPIVQVHFMSPDITDHYRGVTLLGLRGCLIKTVGSHYV